MAVTAQVSATLPPRKGAVCNLTLDAVARAYDISLLPLGGFTPDAAGNRDVRTVLYLEAVGATCYLYFNPTTDATLDDAANQAAASAVLAFGATHAAVIAIGTGKHYIINRAVDKFLIVKGSGAGQLRIHAGSEPTQ